MIQVQEGERVNDGQENVGSVILDRILVPRERIRRRLFSVVPPDVRERGRQVQRHDGPENVGQERGTDGQSDEPGA